MPKFFTHLDNNPLLMSFRTPEAKLEEKKLNISSDWQDTIHELMHQQAESLHIEAAMIMHAYNGAQIPFALFLRNFETEASHFSSPESDGDKRQSIFKVVGPGKTEISIAAALKNVMSVLAVSNPFDLPTRFPIPRIILPNEGWETSVQNLIEHAHLIIFDCQILAPGVVAELELIKKANRQSDTILILQRDDKETNNSLDLMKILGAETPYHLQLTLEDPRFEEFPRKDFSDNISFGDILSSPHFSDLLCTAIEKIASAPEFNVKDQANLIAHEGVDMLNNGNFPGALDRFTQTYLMARHLNDQELLLSTYINFGVTYSNSAHYEYALVYFQGAIEIARELKKYADEGLVMSYAAFAYKQLGKRKEAKLHFIQACALQKKYGEPKDIDNTIKHLATLYEEEGDGDSMVSCYAGLRQWYRDKKDLVGELRSNFCLLVVYYQAGLVPQVKTLAEECLRLSRLTGDQESEAVALKTLETIEG